MAVGQQRSTPAVVLAKELEKESDKVQTVEDTLTQREKAMKEFTVRDHLLGKELDRVEDKRTGLTAKAPKLAKNDYWRSNIWSDAAFERRCAHKVIRHYEEMQDHANEQVCRTMKAVEEAMAIWKRAAWARDLAARARKYTVEQRKHAVKEIEHTITLELNTIGAKRAMEEVKLAIDSIKCVNKASERALAR
ncbi:hypothetical protein K470DRAFT_269940 [Piedraia hortae CBS 480.64]|uniref:Uncharacterized protein n=1 Tax=Piedraia hortae CBS 480.64 TaxID=1314780 RepID=A0A6A7C165_9PEZI|nr:hypothetical protein K470DRAFT_269940 [Piedraia hortae CBS 480.64]